MKYERVNGFHYVQRKSDWYVLIGGKWFKCARPRQDCKTPLLIQDDIQAKENKGG